MSTTDDAVVSALAPPFVFVDLYSGDLGGQPKWDVLPGLANVRGVIVKAMEGTSLHDHGWFKEAWPKVKALGADQYGTSWFRGAYLFVRFADSGVDQADAYLAAVEAAGGWESGDILPIVDVEQGGEQHANRQANAQMVTECVSTCAQRLREVTGRGVILYGRGAMRDLGIRDKMGCDVVWNPSYTKKMSRHGLEAWALDDIVLWQYCGDGQATVENLPHELPGFGKVDLSVYVQGAEKPTLEALRRRLLGV